MYDILKTIEFLGGHISKNEIVSMKLQSFYNKMAEKKMILVMEVTAKTLSQCECFLEICKIWLNYVSHIKNNRISLSPYIKKLNCFHETSIVLGQNDKEENDLGHRVTARK